MAEQATGNPALLLNPQLLSRLSARQKLGAMATVAMAIALLMGAWLWTKEPPYGVLFSNLSDQDGGQIVTTLQQQNVPYKYSEGGGAILVPAGMVHDVRLRLASQGLPKGGLIGFEIMENQKLGISQFAEQINYQRGLEGELSRSIQTLGAVRAARVHLAIPKQTAFLRDELKPSASVLVSLQPGRSLEGAQIAGIVHLVSSSVPQLNPANVSVIDQDGNLVSQKRDPMRNAGLDADQLKYVKEIESLYMKRVESILEPLLGRNNFRAQVAAEIDFSHIDQVEETFLPNPSPDTAIRSQQTAESGVGNPPAVGVPGALTNQPPVPATAPITNPQAGGVGASGAQNNNYSRNATINYEVDKTVRHTRGTPGVVKRLSVAVAVNHKKGPEKDGKPGKPIPPTADELKRINDLVREAVGFAQARGDSINVAAASFVPAEAEVIPELPLWKDPALVAMAKEIGQYLIFGLIAFLVWTRILKPTFEALAAAARRVEAEQKAAAEMAEVGADAHHAHRASFDDKLKSARDVAHKEPKLIAELIRGWMGAGT